MKLIKAKELIGRTFLTDPADTGESFHARVVKAINKHEHKIIADPRHIKFLCSVNNDQYEEVMSYNNILNYLEDKEDE